MIIKNLTAIPFDLVNADGGMVRLQAFEAVGLDPHPAHAEYYRTAAEFEVTEDAKVAEAPEAVDTEESLAEAYQRLTGSKPDGRWSDKRLQQEIDKLEAGQ